MNKQNKQIEGQLTFPFCVDSSNMVVQSNELICAKQSLGLNAAKLVRSAIMQIVSYDSELKPYKISIKELGTLFDCPTSNIYRDIGKITDEILLNPVFVKQITEKKERWVKIPWVTICEYDSDTGLILQLNPKLKPFLLNLKEHYTQYTLSEVLSMRSVYAIRIFELINSKIMTKKLPKKGVYVIISIQELREFCDCEDKYLEFSNLRMKVIDIAKKEINRVTMYYCDYDYIKKGRQVDAIKFHLSYRYNIP